MRSILVALMILSLTGCASSKKAHRAPHPLSVQSAPAAPNRPTPIPAAPAEQEEDCPGGICHPPH